MSSKLVGPRPLHDLGVTCLILYLATYLVGAGPILGRVWSDGGHATPEQWAYHTLLRQLGSQDHHGNAVRAPEPDPPAAPSLFVAPPADAARIVAATATFPPSAESLSYQASPPGALSLPSGPIERRGPLDAALPTGWSQPPPEQPPPAR